MVRMLGAMVRMLGAMVRMLGAMVRMLRAMVRMLGATIALSAGESAPLRSPACRLRTRVQLCGVVARKAFDALRSYPARTLFRFAMSEPSPRLKRDVYRARPRVRAIPFATEPCLLTPRPPARHGHGSVDRQAILSLESLILFKPPY
eukprot:1194690-Prorocentrum_minimum.AAC.3